MTTTIRLTSPQVAALQTALTYYLENHPDVLDGEADTDAEAVLDMLEEA